MAKQGCSAEQIVNKLQEADVELAKGTAVRQVCRQLRTAAWGTARRRRRRARYRPSGTTRWRPAPLRSARLHRACSSVNQGHRLWYEPWGHVRVVP